VFLWGDVAESMATAIPANRMAGADAAGDVVAAGAMSVVRGPRAVKGASVAPFELLGHVLLIGSG